MVTDRRRSEPPTPDYYEYPWAGLSSARLTVRGTAEVAWSDGTTLDCHPMWLRENAPGPGGINLATRECELDPAHLHRQLSITHVGTADGALEVVFEPERRCATFHPGWLRHIAAQLHQPYALIPEPVVWTAAEYPEPVSHDGACVLVDDDRFCDALCDLARYGLVRLTDCGTDPATVGRVGERIGALRDTNFGLTWHVDVDVSPTTVANTGLRLAPHSDLPTREVPPGLQLLHCVENTVEAGWSTMSDGLAIAEHLQAHDLDAFEALTTLEWVFFNRSPDYDHRWRGAVIDVGDGRIPYTFRAFHPVRAFGAMPAADMDRAYAALRLLSATASSDRFQMRYPFRAGDIVVFDNRRVLHGREAFEPRTGTRRRLIGTYIDTDELYSRLRVLLRRSFPMPTGNAGDETIPTGNAGGGGRPTSDG